ncbi:MAG: 16S rRNA (cytosine(967)-C(5))-methyltransferase RsmB [Oscillospiraceae bacterium]|jgi:16S rRNA (cytosine967-C5)-methyltransferase|nr:16S rRNA (cytosine(967)-C(5))-methyltransferase RsmB [Oscillospiraceae bacterium]
MGGDPRLAAFRLLLRLARGGGYVNLALDAALQREALASQDKAFCAALVYGVVERRRTLEYQLRDLLRQPLQKLQPEARASLLLGLYQLYFMDRVPPHAAINESVQLCKKSKAHYSAGMVNAVLRKASARGLQYPERVADERLWLSVRYSSPEWLCDLWRESYGPDTAEALLAFSLERAPLALRVNPLRCTVAEFSSQLAAAGLANKISPLASECVFLPGGGAVQGLPRFAQGWFHVQDLAAQLCCRVLDAQPGETVFDLCAAPGGKSFTIAEMMGDSGEIVALELHEARVNLISEGARRLGLQSIRAMRGDALQAGRTVGMRKKADRVLCDVPCSGLGILRKKPDIREKTRTEIDKLPEMQYNMLCSAYDCLKDGGTLVYATCTLNPAENEQVCRRFLAGKPEMTAREVLRDIPAWREVGEPWCTLMPHVSGTDGFFIAKFTKG